MFTGSSNPTEVAYWEYFSDVNKTNYQDQDQDINPQDQDQDFHCQDQDQDQDLKKVPRGCLETKPEVENPRWQPINWKYSLLKSQLKDNRNAISTAKPMFSGSSNLTEILIIIVHQTA